jgi:3-hydroxyisobutyrate dehydrogenase
MTQKTAAIDRVSVIGLGSMGHGIARSLIRARFTVVGCDPNPDAAARFAQEGGLVTSTPAEATTDARLVISAVLDGKQTADVLFGSEGCAKVLDQGAVFVSVATMAPNEGRALAERLASQGIYYLDAPVSGGAERAADGTLTILVSGPAEAIDIASPVFAVLGQRVFELGTAVGDASAFKIINQLLAGIHIAAACEAIAFAAAQRLDLSKVYDIIKSSAGNSWMFENRVPHILANDYSPRSATDIFVKDLGIVLDMARTARAPVPLASAALQLFLMTSAAGMGRDDDASIARLYAQIMRIKMPASPNPQTSHEIG